MSEFAHPGRGTAPFTGGVRTDGGVDSARRRRWRAWAARKRAIAVFVAVAIAAVAVVAVLRMLAGPTVVHVGFAVSGSVREEIIGPGTVQSRYAVSLGSRVAGTIDRVLVDVGDEVQKDQLLATLDRTELDALFRSARGAVDSAREDVTLARANLAKARSDLDLARLKDERAKKLVMPGLITLDHADEARGAFLAAQANERASLAVVDARQAAVARLVQQQRVAETILSYTEIKSPMAGVVTRRALEPGSAVAPGAVAFNVVAANALWVATLIDQSLAGRVQVGQRATIRLRSGREVPGHVVRIALEADPVTRELEVDVAFDERPARFAIHEEADVTILGESVSGRTVPLGAVNHGPDGSFVYIVEDGRARRWPVQLGIIGATKALVIAGPSEGTPVVLAPSFVRDGQPVAATGGGG